MCRWRTAYEKPRPDCRWKTYVLERNNPFYTFPWHAVFCLHGVVCYSSAVYDDYILPSISEEVCFRIAIVAEHKWNSTITFMPGLWASQTYLVSHYLEWNAVLNRPLLWSSCSLTLLTTDASHESAHSVTRLSRARGIRNLALTQDSHIILCSHLEEGLCKYSYEHPPALPSSCSFFLLQAGQDTGWPCVYIFHFSTSQKTFHSPLSSSRGAAAVSVTLNCRQF